MDKKFKQLLLLNFLIVIELIPAILVLTALMDLTENMLYKGAFIWLFVGGVLFFIINYLIWRCGKTGRKNRC